MASRTEGGDGACSCTAATPSAPARRSTRAASDMRRSKGESSTVRPVNGWPSCAGSTRQRPGTPSISRSSPTRSADLLADPLRRVQLARRGGDAVARGAEGGEQLVGADAAAFLPGHVRLLGHVRLEPPARARAVGSHAHARGVERQLRQGPEHPGALPQPALLERADEVLEPLHRSRIEQRDEAHRDEVHRDAARLVAVDARHRHTGTPAMRLGVRRASVHRAPRRAGHDGGMRLSGILSAARRALQSEKTRSAARTAADAAAHAGRRFGGGKHAPTVDKAHRAVRQFLDGGPGGPSAGRPGDGQPRR